MLYFFKKIKENTCRYHYQNLDDMIYSSWDTEWNILKLVILGHFLPFYPQKTPKNPNFEKWNTLLEISSLYKCVQKVTIIWCMVPEMWSATDKIFCHFGPFFALLPLPPDKPKNQNFEKLKKTPGDIINLHMYTINDNHMMYVSWDMKCDGQDFLSFWTVFCLFTPLITQNIKILKNEKNTRRYYHSTHVYHE